MDFGLWKDKDELKKFINNLGVEYRFGCFEEKNHQACHLLGDYLLSISHEYSKAAKVYASNCVENKFGLSCNSYAKMVYKGQGVEAPDMKEALEYFLKGCDANEPISCYHAGQLLTVHDKQVRKSLDLNSKLGIKLLEKSCLSMDHPAACTYLHQVLLHGSEDLPADKEKSAAIAKIGCHLNEYQSCYNLSLMYRKGDGVEVDPEYVKYYQGRTRQCMKGHKAALFVTKNDVSPDA